MRRLLSHTEITAALDCWARWDFMYGGHLAGTTLKKRAPHVKLRAGKAWGRGVAAFHQAPATDSRPARYAAGLAAIHASLDEDAAQMRAHLVYDPVEHHDMGQRLADVLWHYAVTTDPLEIHDPEFELRLPIPSRSGRGLSNRYGFHAFLDGLAVKDGYLWIAEYKLRDTLTDPRQIRLGRQYRRYAWAAERLMDVVIAGVIVDECLSEPPKPARWVKARKKGEGVNGRVPSHAKDQLTTAEQYIAACEEADVAPVDETITALNARRWSQRVPVMFRRSEIDEAGQELVSAAKLIAQLDAGHLYPVRNPDPRRCNGCAFKEICPRPDDADVIDLSFDRTVPKRLRGPLEEAATA
jgi:hypothetical protein